MILVVSLYIHPGQAEAFREFEGAAARIMARYGGRIERAIRPTSAIPEVALPHEVHVVTFPDAVAFEAYRADADLAALAPLRQRAIARTEIIVGEEGEGY